MTEEILKGCFNAQPMIRFKSKEFWGSDNRLLIIDSQTKRLLRMYNTEDVTDKILEFELS